MKYELKIVIKQFGRIIVKYRNICSEERYAYVLEKFKEQEAEHKDYILLVNKLDDNGEFQETVI